MDSIDAKVDFNLAASYPNGGPRKTFTAWGINRSNRSIRTLHSGNRRSELMLNWPYQNTFIGVSKRSGFHEKLFQVKTH